ncbi:MAG: RNA polymerase sigma-70 factor [Bacteroides sp.]|nr:RNA polymerase sigma-70 factor [Bacteroides sp.]
MNDLSDFDILFKEYYIPLSSFAHSLIDDWEASRDIVSDAFEHVWKNFAKLEKSTVKSYLFLYVKNRSIDYLRHQDIRHNYAELFLKLEANYAEINFDEQDERILKIKKAIECLPPQTRHVLEECYLREKKYKEVAAEMGFSIGAVQKHIVKALRIIREKIAKEK